jgi:hypothetical protein
MLRKIVVSLLLAAVLCQPAFSLVKAYPGVDNIQIKKGEESDNVILLQFRLQDLGYYNYKITGFFGDFTSEALKSFQQTNNLTADGVAGDKTLDLLYGNDAKRMDVKSIDEPHKSVTTKHKVYGAMVDWSKVDKLWKIGTRCKVVDFDTGITYYMIRCNQSYSVGHADVAPASKADTAKMKSTFGGELNGYRRALVVYIGGQAIAGSLFGEPHGSTGVAGNGLNLASGKLQQVCIHFLNSRNNIHDMIDPAHQYQIKRAAGKPLPASRPALVYPGD